MASYRQPTIPQRIKEFRESFEATAVELLLLAIFLTGVWKITKLLLF
jgi:hypothetical protein